MQPLVPSTALRPTHSSQRQLTSSLDKRNELCASQATILLTGRQDMSLNRGCPILVVCLLLPSSSSSSQAYLRGLSGINVSSKVSTAYRTGESNVLSYRSVTDSQPCTVCRLVTALFARKGHHPQWLSGIRHYHGTKGCE